LATGNRQRKFEGCSLFQYLLLLTANYDRFDSENSHLKTEKSQVNANKVSSIKKRYIAHFVSKVTDSDSENSETSGWLDFSLACKYLTETSFKKLNSKSEEVGRLLHHMINNPDQY